MKKILIALLILYGTLFQVEAHDFNTEAFAYILSQPESSFTDFTNHMEGVEDEDYADILGDVDQRLSSILSLPGKKYVVNYTKKNPDFTYNDIQREIINDPMLGEIGAEQIYLFLSKKFQPQTKFSWNLFGKIVKEGIIHILSGIDHILFLLLLIIAVKKAKSIIYIATIFSVSHSISLILSGLDLFTIQSIFVESGITLSIIFLGLFEIQRSGKKTESNWKLYMLVFLLGLVHGLGFAGFFKDLMQVSSSPLQLILGFNIGVEIGQIIILLLGVGLLLIIYKYFGKYKVEIQKSLNWIIVLYGVYLFYSLLLM